ncbi:MAG: hypothetical protein H0U95_01095 [Bacteroidetes bacterium]|nr:hypothetical protein [Bacteroidota bacterium]
MPELSPEQKQKVEDSLLIIQGLILLLEKVKLNKTVVDLEGNKTEDNKALIFYYSRTELRIEKLKLDLITNLEY